MSDTGVALRLARREVLRRPWRSLMVMLLVIVPVIVLTGLAVLVRTNDRTLEERFADRWGHADVAVRSGEGDVLDRLGPHLQRGRTLTFYDDISRIRTADGERPHANLTDVPVDDPMVDGMVIDLRGRAPDGPDEVLLSAPLADALDVGIGDTLELTRPAEASFTVVGTARWRYELSRPVIVVDAHNGLVAEAARRTGREAASTMTLVDLPPAAESDPQVLASLRDAGVSNGLVEPWPDGGNSAGLAIVWSWVGGSVAFVIVGVVIAAAFAVTARRQLRLIGQLMSNGASERTLRATLFLQGSVIGLAGALAGIGIAVGGLVLGEPLVERLLDRRLDGYTVRLADLVPIVALATAAATIAALIPARTAIRTSVLQALAGRRPVGPYPNKLVTRGALVVLAGLVLLAVATAGAANRAGQGPGSAWLFVLTGIAGAVSVILGTCAMSPGIISCLEPLAGHLRGTARLAARSVARQRSRTGALVAAVAVVAAGAVAGSTAWLSSEAEAANNDHWEVPGDVVMVDHTVETFTGSTGEAPQFTYEPVRISDELLDPILGVVPDAEVVHTEEANVPDAEGPAPSVDGPGSGMSAAGEMIARGFTYQVVDAEAAAALELDMELRAALDEVGLVVQAWGSEEPLAGPTELQAVLTDDDGREFARVDAIAVSGGLPTSPGLITPWRAEELGLELEPGPALVVSPSRLSDEQLAAIGDIRDDIAFETDHEQRFALETGEQAATEPVRFDQIWISYEDRNWEPSRSLITAGIVGVATLFSLGVVALGLALAAAETKDERDVLAAIGARPRTLRRLAGAKAAVLAAAGTAIGVPLGFVPTWVVIRAGDAGAPAVVFPWLQAVLLVLVVPAVATVAATAASGLALHLRPVQASSMAFD